jgi:hypothetical protein
MTKPALAVKGAQARTTKKPAKCWDCGSTIPGHHTPLCDLAEEGDVRDLPQQPGTQWWTGEAPNK